MTTRPNAPVATCCRSLHMKADDVSVSICVRGQVSLCLDTKSTSICLHFNLNRWVSHYLCSSSPCKPLSRHWHHCSCCVPVVGNRDLLRAYTVPNIMQMREKTKQTLGQDINKDKVPTGSLLDTSVNAFDHKSLTFYHGSARTWRHWTRRAQVSFFFLS